MFLPSSPIKILGKSVQGFLHYDWTNKQTDKQRLQLYILRYTARACCANKSKVYLTKEETLLLKAVFLLQSVILTLHTKLWSCVQDAVTQFPGLSTLLEFIRAQRFGSSCGF